MNDEYFAGQRSVAPLRSPESRRSVNDEYANVADAAADIAAPVASRTGAPSTLPSSMAQSRPLQIASVGPSFAIGGVEQHLAALAKFLDPSVAVIKQCLVTDPARLDVNTARTLGPAVTVRACDKEQLRDAVRGMDVVLAWGDSFNHCFDPNGPTVVYIAHGDCWWTRKGLEGSAQVVHHVIAVSSRVQQRQCAGFPSTVILNGVDTSRLARCRAPGVLRTELGLRADDFVIGTVGRMTGEKQMHLLIEAVHLLPTNFKLLLVGGGPRQAELLAQANDLIPGRYALRRVNDFLGDYYGAMDAFALVSAHEGFGLVIAEALHCGRPVIATDVGCVGEVLEHRVSGLVVQPDPDEIAEAAKLIYQHPRWARGMAAEGQAIAQRRLQAKQMSEQYGRVLQQVHAARLAAGRAGVT